MRRAISPLVSRYYLILQRCQIQSLPSHHLDGLVHAIGLEIFRLARCVIHWSGKGFSSFWIPIAVSLVSKSCSMISGRSKVRRKILHR